MAGTRSPSLSWSDGSPTPPGSVRIIRAPSESSPTTQRPKSTARFRVRDRAGERLSVVAALVVALAGLVRPLRARWRPVSGAVALATSARLAPGDHAWYVRPGFAERVLVTARHRTHIVIVRLADESAEGLRVRRTRVLLVRADSA